MPNNAQKKIFDHKLFLKNLTNRPGVYQMFADNDEILYVGKAGNLKKRVSSYFLRRNENPRIVSLVSQIARIEVIITDSENDALLLESNLIKNLKPRYNVLFRDDKSYPYIYLSAHSDFPRLDFHRGTKSKKGQYFGPFPSTTAVRESLNLLQKLFRIRQCSDTFFKNRSRPCIQYQIKRCTAPCVNYIEPQAYQQNVKLAKLFLEGKNQQLITQLIKKMEIASEKLAFEEAARYRDQITSLRKVQERQYVTGSRGNIDIIAAVTNADQACVNILFIRNGRIIGSRGHFPKLPKASTVKEILSAFIPQYYLSPTHQKDIPKAILLNEKLDDVQLLSQSLSKKAEHTVEISKPQRGERIRWLKMSITNAKSSLAHHLSSKLDFYQRLEALQQALNLASLPQRLECFDISHSSGEATVASCVVFNSEGPLKSDYRRFNIENVTKGDDYAAMKQALMRRYTKLKRGEGVFPDLLVIDGGKGQLRQALDILEELQISGVAVLGIAKGPTRKPGLEKLFLSSNNMQIYLEPDSLALHLLQQIRDEAHRFAITGHKHRREKARKTSILENILGVGSKKRRDLLHYFGGLQEIKRASVEAIAKVPGISPVLAKRVYDSLH